MAPKLHFLIVDPQNDFCDPRGSLYVKGAETDMERLARLIRRLSGRVDAIHVTLDTHHPVDVAHPVFWVDPEGRHPAPFTIITPEDVESGRYVPADPAHRDRMAGYVRALAERGRYPLTVWPPHCLIGSWGGNVYDPVETALLEWEKGPVMVDYAVKGTNPFTEHYSVLQAEVPDESDPSTLPNARLVDALGMADVIALGGEALSHCVANTVRDLARMSPETARKLVLLTDCSSPVPGFEEKAESFLKEAAANGIRLASAEDFLAERRNVA